MSVIVSGSATDTDYQIEYIEKWTVIDSKGKSFETGRSYDDERALNEDFTIVSRLPDNIGIESILCFRNRSDVKVYINGELRKEFSRSGDSIIPGGSVKEFYLSIPLSEKDAGGELRIIRGKTDRNPFVVSPTFVTTDSGLYYYMMSHYGLSFILAVILFIISIFASLIGIFMSIRLRRNIDMLYGALGVLDITCWLLSISQITPYFTKIYYVDGLMSYFFTMMMPFALIIYLNSVQKQRYKRICLGVFALSLASFILWTILHFTGIQSFQSSLVPIDMILAVSVLTLSITVILDVKTGCIKEYKYTALGFASLMIAAVVQIVLLVFFSDDASGIPLMFGISMLLVFVIIQQVFDLKKASNELQEKIDRQTEEKEQMLIHIVQTLAGTIDAKDKYTNGHSGRVANYSTEIARRCGYSDTELNDIYMIGLLHDIGKIGIPDAVINKPSALTDEEYKIIKQHPVMGARILDNITEKPELSSGARWHHERYGGGGYPDGIAGEDIPEKARIIAVADAYDAMTSNRSYRKPLPQETVIEEIKKGIGTQFDPRFAEIMLEIISEDTDYIMREESED